MPQTNYRQHQVNGLTVTCFENKSDAVDFIYENFILKSMPGSAIAVNPEKIVKSVEDENTKLILEKASFLYPDGIGVVKLLKHRFGGSISRIPGCELWELLMNKAAIEGTPVYLLGAKPEVVAQTAERLSSEFNTKIVGYRDGYFSDEIDVIDSIKSSGAKIVAIALGSPKQEFLIEKCINEGVNAFFMGVGGTFDVYTGNVDRAPEIFLKLNLEWFYRLASQPTRWRRQLNLVKFIQLAFKNEI